MGRGRDAVAQDTLNGQFTSFRFYEIFLHFYTGHKAGIEVPRQ